MNRTEFLAVCGNWYDGLLTLKEFLSYILDIAPDYKER